MPNPPFGPSLYVVPTAKAADGLSPAEHPGTVAAPGTVSPDGGPDDPRMKEAMRLMEAFLAIEDAGGRAALVVLAERLVSHDWARKVQQR